MKTSQSSANPPSNARDPREWLDPFLAQHGYTREGESVYTNGRARIEISESMLRAIPADGTNPWITQVHTVSPAAITVALSQLLRLSGFLSPTELTRLEARQEKAECALHYFSTEISLHPDDDQGIQLRRLLWSMYNAHHPISLWTLKDTLKPRQQAAAALLIIAWQQGHVSEDALKQTLKDCGEMDRWDAAKLTMESMNRLDAALAEISLLLGTIPPGPASPKVARLLEALRHAVDNFQK